MHEYVMCCIELLTKILYFFSIRIAYFRAYSTNGTVVYILVQLMSHMPAAILVHRIINWVPQVRHL